MGEKSTLAVHFAAPDVDDLLLSVSRWHGAEGLETLWKRVIPVAPGAG